MNNIHSKLNLHLKLDHFLSLKIRAKGLLPT